MVNVSVIVPVYNAEKLLARCVDSILNQTYTDYEIILVDDGSTDKSPEICDTYAKNHANIRCIHKQNGGISDARNKGIDIAQGKYLMFCDNDDYVEPHWMQTLVKYIEKYPDSLVNCQYTIVDVDGNKDLVKIPGYDEVTEVPISEYYIFYKYNYSPNNWIRIFPMEKIKKYNIRFKKIPHLIGEDVPFNIDFMKYCKSLVYIPVNGYYWVDNGGSESRNYNPDRYNSIKVLYNYRKPYISEKYMQEYYNEYFFRFYNCLKYVMSDNNSESKKDKIKRCNAILHDESFIEVLNKCDEATCNKKLKLLLSFKNYRLVLLYNRIYK